MWNALKNRFKEPSSWAGLAALAVMFGAPPQSVDAVMGVVNAVASGPIDPAHVIGAVCAAVAVFVPERRAS